MTVSTDPAGLRTAFELWLGERLAQAGIDYRRLDMESVVSDILGSKPRLAALIADLEDVSRRSDPMGSA